MQGLNVNVCQRHKPAFHISNLNIPVTLLAQNDGKCSLLTRVGKTGSHSYLKKSVFTFFFMFWLHFCSLMSFFCDLIRNRLK